MPIFETEAIMNKKGRIEELEALYQTLKPVQHYILNIRVGATDFSNLFGIRRTISQTIHMVQVIEDCLGILLISLVKIMSVPHLSGNILVLTTQILRKLQHG